MKRYTNSIKLFVKMATVLYVAIFAVNTVLPVLDGDTLNVSLFTVAILILWAVALLSSHGYLKQIEYTDGSRIVYTTILPLFPAAVVRVVEFGWYFFRERSMFRLGVFGIDVFLDVLFVIVILLDKSHYYFEAVEEDQNG